MKLRISSSQYHQSHTYSPECMKARDLKKRLADLEIDVIAVALVSTPSRTGEQNREHPQRHTHRASLRLQMDRLMKSY